VASYLEGGVWQKLEMLNSEGFCMKGYVHVYTGEGKGKTTATLGLIIRAAGAGMKVFLAQFLKKGDYSELNALQRFDDLITVEQYGVGRFIKGKPLPEDIEGARRGLEKVKAVLASGKYDMVVLDEANVALHFKLFSLEDLLALIDSRPEATELVITGRNAAPELIARADLVTEMREIKHYYDAGVTARVGIEK